MPIGNGPDYYSGVNREEDERVKLMDEIYDWWDSLTEEEQYNLMLDWYPNDFMEDDNADSFFGDMDSDKQLWIWKRENKLTEGDIQGQKDIAGDMEYEERKLRGDDME